jgi:hypothetical protein
MQKLFFFKCTFMQNINLIIFMACINAHNIGQVMVQSIHWIRLHFSYITIPLSSRPTASLVVKYWIILLLLLLVLLQVLIVLILSPFDCLLPLHFINCSQFSLHSIWLPQLPCFIGWSQFSLHHPLIVASSPASLNGVSSWVVTTWLSPHLCYTDWSQFSLHHPLIVASSSLH